MTPDWKSALARADKAPRCGAKTRKAGNPPCMSPAMPNGRCRMHGGKSPGAPKGTNHGNYRHGGYSQEAKAEKHYIRELILQTKELCTKI